MSIQYSVLGFKHTTFGTWVSSHNHLTRATIRYIVAGYIVVGYILVGCIVFGCVVVGVGFIVICWITYQASTRIQQKKVWILSGRFFWGEIECEKILDDFLWIDAFVFQFKNLNLNWANCGVEQIFVCNKMKNSVKSLLAFWMIQCSLQTLSSREYSN